MKWSDTSPWWMVIKSSSSCAACPCFALSRSCAFKILFSFPCLRKKKNRKSLTYNSLPSPPKTDQLVLCIQEPTSNHLSRVAKINQKQLSSRTFLISEVQAQPKIVFSALNSSKTLNPLILENWKSKAIRWTKTNLSQSPNCPWSKSMWTLRLLE